MSHRTLAGAIAGPCPRKWARQTIPERERAGPSRRTAWAFMRDEAWPDAAKAFQQAIDIDRDFEDAYYGLGLASMRHEEIRGGHCRLREVPRSLPRAGRQAVRQPPGCAALSPGSPHRDRRGHPAVFKRARRRRPPRTACGSSTAATGDPGLHHAREQTSPSRTRCPRSSIWRSAAPISGPSSSPDAEREYKAAITADPKSGEALNNLAVVYMQTGRYKEADDALKSAEKAGFKVHPQLKLEIKAKLEDGKGKLE